MAKSKKSAGKSRKTHRSSRRRSYRRRSGRSLGLAGISAPKANDLKNDLIDIAATAVGTYAAAKGVGMLDKMINKSGSKMMGYVAPAVVTAAGMAGAALMGKNPAVKSFAKGVAMGGVIKLAEKALNKDNLLAGVDDQPLMLPGIGSFGQAVLPEKLPELSHYSQNPNADVTTTGGDWAYRMGQPSEQLSGDDEDFIAV